MDTNESIIRPPMAASVPLVIFLCCFTYFHKNGTNNCKITKLSANTFEHSDKLQSKIQWRSFIRSWVIRLWFLYMYYIFMLFFRNSQKQNKHLKKTRNVQQILFNIWVSFSQNFNVSFNRSWVIRPCFLYLYYTFMLLFRN